MSVPYFGDFSEDDTVLIPFNTFDSNDPQASVTITNLADADIMVHKDGGLTQIATDGATVAINFDSITGNHLITVDTSASADYAVGSEYAVRIEGTTVDAGTINAWVGAFSIERAGGALAITKLIQAAVITNAAGTDIAADIADIPTVAEFNARTLVAASYFDPAADAVANVTLVATTTTNTDMRGTDSAATATALATAQTDLDIITDADGIILGAAAVDLIWDEVLTGATHNITNSAGKRLRQVDAAFTVHSGTAQAGTANTITLDAGADANDDIYAGTRCIIIAGTGIEEHGIIISYVGATKVATMSESWVVTPDATSEFELTPASVNVDTWAHKIVTASPAGLPDVNVNEVGDTAQTAGDLAALINTVDTVVDGIQTDLSNGADGLGAIKADTAAAATSAALATVDSNVDAILVDTSTTIPATITTLQTDSTNLLLGIIFGAAATGTLSTTQATSDLTGYTASQLIGRTIIVTSGQADGEGSDITAYSATNGLLTFTAMTLAMGNTDTFKIV